LLINANIWEWLTFNNGDTNTIAPPNNALQQMDLSKMDLLVFPHIRYINWAWHWNPHASPMDIQAPKINDQ
jgi:hypothetical protein